MTKCTAVTPDPAVDERVWIGALVAACYRVLAESVYTVVKTFEKMSYDRIENQILKSFSSNTCVHSL